MPSNISGPAFGPHFSDSDRMAATLKLAKHYGLTIIFWTVASLVTVGLVAFVGGLVRALGPMVVATPAPWLLLSDLFYSKNPLVVGFASLVNLAVLAAGFALFCIALAMTHHAIKPPKPVLPVPARPRFDD